MTYAIKDVMGDLKRTPPLKSYLWYVSLPNLTANLGFNGILHDDAAETINKLYQNDSRIHESIQKRITNVSIPFVTVETDKAIIGNSFWYYGKQNDIGTITMEVFEFEDGKTLDYFDAWKSLMINPNGTYNSPVEYKQNIVFWRLSATKKEIIFHNYSGYFVSGIADINNDYETNEIVKYAVNFTGDSVETAKTSIAGLIDDPSVLDQLSNIMSLDSILPSLETVLDAQLDNFAGVNLPSIPDIF